MADDDCVRFLQECLPRLGLRWAGYRKVRGTVCKRVRRRLRALGLDGLDAYRARLADDPDEWARLDALCRIPISRFYRDKATFDALGDRVLPDLARAVTGGAVRCWSAGCASGEEAYTVALVWAFRCRTAFPDVTLSVLGTDADDVMLTRAEAGFYEHGSLRDLPAHWREQAFAPDGTRFRLRNEHRTHVSFERQDIRQAMPDGPFDLILCRNLAFTYFAAPVQTTVLDGLCERLTPGGALVIGGHERLPALPPDLVAEAGVPVYRRH